MAVCSSVNYLGNDEQKDMLLFKSCTEGLHVN